MPIQSCRQQRPTHRDIHPGDGGRPCPAEQCPAHPARRPADPTPGLPGARSPRGNRKRAGPPGLPPPRSGDRGAFTGRPRGHLAWAARLRRDTREHPDPPAQAKESDPCQRRACPGLCGGIRPGHRSDVHLHDPHGSRCAIDRGGAGSCLGSSRWGRSEHAHCPLRGAAADGGARRHGRTPCPVPLVLHTHDIGGRDRPDPATDRRRGRHDPGPPCSGSSGDDRTGQGRQAGSQRTDLQAERECPCRPWPRRHLSDAQRVRDGPARSSRMSWSTARSPTGRSRTCST